MAGRLRVGTVGRGAVPGRGPGTRRRRSGPRDGAHGEGPGRPGHHDRPVRQRAALLHPGQQATGQPNRAAAGGKRGLDPGRRRPAGARALRRAHGLQRDEELPEGCRPQVLRVDRHAVRPQPERLHQLRPDGLHAADPGRQAGGGPEGIPDPRRLGTQPLVRARGDRQGARRHRRGVAAGPRRGRTDAGQAAADHAEGLSLRREAADRQEGGHRDLQARPAEEVLQRLVPARPDGGRRRR
jgi:hypothetical protein